MMRPRVAWPTGTEIGPPVVCTAKPRFRPSEAPMAMVRTTPSPSCCCTSRIRSESRELQRLVDMRDVLARKFDVDDRADDLGDFSLHAMSLLIRLRRRRRFPKVPS